MKTKIFLLAVAYAVWIAGCFVGAARAEDTYAAVDVNSSASVDVVTAASSQRAYDREVAREAKRERAREKAEKAKAAHRARVAEAHRMVRMLNEARNTALDDDGC